MGIRVEDLSYRVLRASLHFRMLVTVLIVGAHVMGNTKYVVSDDKLYSVGSGVTELGSIPHGSQVQIWPTTGLS